MLASAIIGFLLGYAFVALLPAAWSLLKISFEIVRALFELFREIYELIRYGVQDPTKEPTPNRP